MTTTEQLNVFKAKDRYGSEMEFEIIEPTLAIEAEGEMQYRIAFSQGIKQGILTRDKMREVLKAQGILGDDDDNVLQEAIREVGKLEIKFQRAQLSKDQQQCTEIATELFKTRQRMLQLFMVVNAAYTNSAEGFAEMIKQEAVMAACTVIKTNKQRYWKTYKDYILERDGETQSNVVECLHEAFTKIMTAKSNEMLEDCPESKHLKTVRERILDRVVNEAKEADATLKERIDGTGIIRSEVDQADSDDSSVSSQGMGENASPSGEVDAV